jgi:acetyl-CoA acetyltransferase
VTLRLRRVPRPRRVRVALFPDPRRGRSPAVRGRREAPESSLNPLGGAIALGHPLGASGARIMTTVVPHLRDTQTRWGLQTMCEAGGLVNATLLEAL